MSVDHEIEQPGSERTIVMHGNSNMTRSDADSLDEAVIREWSWKTPAMRQMSRPIWRLVLEKVGQEFSANDLPQFEHGGAGICGSIFRGLIKDGVISPV